MLFVFVLTCSVLLALGLFLFWHTWLVCTNQTTIEFYCNRFDALEARREGRAFRNPYTVGVRANVEQVFGRSPRAGLLGALAWTLPSLAKPPGDGVSFPSNPRDLLHHV